MTAQPEALRLAQELDAYHTRSCHKEAAAELRRLHADAEESEALRERLSALLTSTAIALRGPAPELVSWSWHDLPERAAALVAQRDALLEALKDLMQQYKDQPECFMDWSKARAAIKAVQETK